MKVLFVEPPKDYWFVSWRNLLKEGTKRKLYRYRASQGIVNQVKNLF